MRFSHILFLVLVAIVATTLGAPVAEEEFVPTTVSPVEQSDDAADPTEVPEEVTTVLPVSDDEAEDGSVREGRQIDDGEEDDDGEQDDEEDDDDEDEDADEEEEEEDRKRAGSKPIKPKKKSPVPAKPVPHLDQGVEDDEAEDLGIFERDEPKSSDEAVADKGSDEDADDEDNEDDDEEGGSDEDDDEDGDEPARSTGLVAEPVSSERGDVEDVIPPVAPAPVKSEPEQPLAIAVVQPEETADPVVPILVEESDPSSSVVAESKDESKKSHKKKGSKKPEPQADDDDDEEDDDEEDEDEEDDEGRSEKIHRARSAYPSSPVLYYYPFPDAPVAEY